MFDSIPKQRLSDTVYEQLMDRIVDRSLQPGSELPAERILAETLGVNRGAVREALKRLQQAGLIQIRQGGNSVVLDYEAEGGLELLPSLLTTADGQLNPAVARAIMAMRSSLAPDIAASAAHKGGMALADELDDLLRKMRSSAKNTAALQTLAHTFWSRLVERGGNIAYRLAFNSMNKTYKAIWPLLTQVLEPEFRDLDTLQRLANAVREGDAAMASACARKHVEIGRAALDKTLRTLDKTRR
jgi:GntR family transcriptional regulator, transcriptional repressor for pyruvate dehydrogenase complex